MKVRHLILCKEIKINDEYNFDAIGIYEYLSAETFPTIAPLTLSLGLYFAQPGESYTIRVTVLQNGKPLAHWIAPDLQVYFKDEVLNVCLEGQIPLASEGFLLFLIESNGQTIDEQIVSVRKVVNKG